MSVAAAKRCEFDSLGKMLRQIREWIAALSAPEAMLDIPHTHHRIFRSELVDKSPRHPIEGRGVVMPPVL
jgi:hypothetical protein